MLRRSIRILFVLVSVTIIVMAFLVSVARLFFPYFEEYRIDIESWASEELKRPVKVKEVVADWGGLQPRLRIKGVSVYVPDGSRIWIRFKEVQVYFNIFASLREWRLRPGKINIVGADVDVEYRSGHYYIGGIKVDTEHRLGRSRLLNWMLQREKLVVTKGVMTWRDPRISAKKQYLKDINLLLSFQQNRYHFSGSFRHKNKGNNKFYFIVNLLGSFKDWKNMQRRFFFSGNATLGPWLNKDLLSNVRVYHGKMDFRLWGEGRGRIERLYGDFNIGNLRWKRVDRSLVRLPAMIEHKPFTLQRLSANFLWRDRGQGWSVSVNDMRVRRAGRDWPVSRVYLQYDRTRVADGWYREVTGSIKFARLDDLGRLMLSVLPVDSKLRTRLATYRPRGDIADLEFNLKKSPTAPLKFYYTFGFDRLSVADLPKKIEFSGLSGRVTANTLGGFVTLDTKKARVKFPALFRTPLALKQASGTVQWKKLGDNTVFSTPRLVVDGDHVSTVTRMKLILRDSKPGYLDIGVSFRDGDLDHFFTYLPERIMRPSLVGWLKKSISRGRITSGTARYKGFLDAKAFNTGSNILSVDFSVAGTRLKYHPQWPAIDDIAADVRFFGKYMRVRMNSGQVFGMELMPSTVTIPSLNKKAVLSLRGSMLGPARDALRFFSAIPSSAGKNSFLSRFSAEGNASLNVNLVLPLAALSKRKFIGRVEFLDSSLRHTDWNYKLTGVNGTLHYESDGEFIRLYAKDIKAGFKSRPVTVNIVTRKSPAGEHFDTIVALKTKMRLSRLLGHFSNLFHGIVYGISEWKVSFRIRQYVNSPLKVTIRFDSDLLGSGVRLPEGFAKARGTRRRFSMQADITGLRLGVVRLDYGGLLSSALLIEPQSNGEHYLRKGEIRFGGQKASLPDVDQLRITGKLKSFSLSTWLDWIEKKGSLKKQGQGILDNINYLDLHFGELELVGNRLHNISLYAKKQVRYWHARVKGREIEGDLQIPLFVNDNDPITVRLKKLMLADSGEHEDDKDDKRLVPDPRQLPPLRIVSEKFYYNGSYYGKLNIFASRAGDGLAFEVISMTADDLKINAKGNWKYASGVHMSQFDIVAETRDLGAALERRKYTASLKGGVAKAKIRAYWRGPPTWYRLKRVNGSLSVVVRKGRVVDVKPGGGKMLGVFSIQALPRRLSLDFSDVFKKGLSFDRIKADFNISDGDAYTHNFRMEGPAVVVDIRGRIGLADQDYDQTISVTPKLTANLPLVGGIAAGPQVGLGLWVANQVIGKKLNKISKREYTLQGTWSKPLITRKKKPLRIKPDEDINWADRSE